MRETQRLEILLSLVCLAIRGSLGDLTEETQTPTEVALVRLQLGALT
jgi:hypothetical protein